MTQSLKRNIKGRVFRGTLSAESGPWDLTAMVYDRHVMPALDIANGSSFFQEFRLDQAESATIPLPEAAVTASVIYVAVRCNLLTRITYTSPTLGTGKKVLIKATDSTADGEHMGFWVYQGDLTSLAISIPSTADGGATTLVSVMMYIVPDLTLAASFTDRNQGLGT